MRVCLNTLSWSSAAFLLALLPTLTPQKSAVAIDCNASTRDGKLTQCPPRREPLKRAKTALVEFTTSPFPYDGIVPEKDTAFLNVLFGERRGHRSPHGRILWEDVTYRERRVLLHIPKGFDFNRPSVMIVFFHGHGA